MEISTIVLSAIVSIIVAYATAKASSYSKDVVGERKEWRNKMRELTVEVFQMVRSEETQSQRFNDIVAEFRLRLNPDSCDDNQILETLEMCMRAPDCMLGKKLLAQVARLLKHDWERSKSETRLLGFFKPNEKEIRRLRSSDYLDL
ncbi:cell division protein FtsL [Sulfitobacter undariae]|uniref:Cell division protein FtsL n=1 Tax=Sulfitobacter undariae TaxID=1563671 RepID=A0A7W6E7Q6_9RHOB|nr:hypothetical protein [Sulfitobacter undariae]MBB3994991.1 cell division protein FtsL [Sulfitobacter undariae]